MKNRTEAVGFHIAPSGITHGFRWTPTSGLADVGSLTGVTPPWSYTAPLSITRFIRSDGLMAGGARRLRGRLAAGGPGGDARAGVANSVNDFGVAVGATRLSNGQPVVWRDGRANVITDLPGEATDVNAAGYVVA